MLRTLWFFFLFYVLRWVHTYWKPYWSVHESGELTDRKKRRWWKVWRKVSGEGRRIVQNSLGFSALPENCTLMVTLPNSNQRHCNYKLMRGVYVTYCIFATDLNESKKIDCMTLWFHVRFLVGFHYNFASSTNNYEHNKTNSDCLFHGNIFSTSRVVLSFFSVKFCQLLFSNNDFGNAMRTKNCQAAAPSSNVRMAIDFHDNTDIFPKIWCFPWQNG